MIVSVIKLPATEHVGPAYPVPVAYAATMR